MRRSQAIRVRAHAKINISLRVLGRRPDGYHDLWTVFQSIALHDTIFVAPHDGPMEVTATDPAVPTGDANIVWRAAHAVWRASKRRGRPQGVHVHIVKRIPAGGGLGGGSSDAVATMRALDAWWRLGLDRPALGKIACGLGADVPYFLHGGTGLGLARGDLIVPLPDLAPEWLVLVMPPFTVSTAAAFQWFDSRRPARPAAARIALSVPGAAGLINDLEPVVASRHPDIARITRVLLRSGATAAAMTGSGSTVFGLFRTRAAAQRAADRLAGRGSAALVSRFVGRSAFLRASRPARVRSLPRSGRIG